MGTCASLFHSTDVDAQTLHRRVRPSDQQYEAQKAEWNSLRDFIVEGLKEDTGLAINSWLQGSYKFGTQIRPSKKGEQFDIDLGIYAGWAGKCTEGPIGPRELKEKVHSLLQVYASEADDGRCEVMEPKERCNRIQIGDDFHIDTPCYHLDQAQDARNLATQSDEWEASDPKAIYLWWRDSFPEEFRPRARRIVQYFKMWAALTFEDGSRPSSVMLTVLVGQAMHSIDADGLSGDDEWFAAVVSHLSDEVELGCVPNPVDKGENLNRLSADQTNAIKSALSVLAEISNRALNADNKWVASEIWSEAFQQFFPIPDEPVIKENAGAIVQFNFDPQVSVRAVPRGSGTAGITGVNRIGPIPRNCEIYFELSNSDALPPNSKVKWTVRNQGADAEDENDLGHAAGFGYKAQESSAYIGTHYMDVSVWQYGSLIGRRRVPVEISGHKMPPRNAPKPNWVKFRSRRR